ncbi:MAG TPA: MBL fold metallo-hydrolase [Anaerolineae bacterium]|nr:MBL fold metallo-hydrolase [Anaerolineae bacterium]HQK13690.1 MBL fold metallo-hydrolase [Anaerolineae bacterium]
MNAQELVKRLHWLGHDSFRLDGPPVIYFDPWKLKGNLPTADLVLVSHHHPDHCSSADIKKISGPNTVVIASHMAAKELPGAQAMRPGDKLSVAGVEVEAVPAYNVNKFRAPGVPFHPKNEQHVGYIVTVEGVRVYFAGDTDHIPEMADFRCDIALLPVSGTYVMTVEEAVAAARDIKAEITIPMHYGSGIGSADDGARFNALLKR